MNKNIFEIKIPHLNANEDEVRLVEVNYENFEYVKKNDNICSIESSKITQEITAERNGYIKYLYEKDEYIKNNETLAIIAEDLSYLKTLENKLDKKPEIQFTKKAQKLIEEHEISLENFKNSKFTIIKEKDVINFISKSSHSKHSPLSNETNSQIMTSVQKQIAKNVKKSQEDNATTYLTVDLKRKEIENLCKEKTDSLNIAVSLFDLFLFSISKTLKNFPLLNSHIEDDVIITKEDVNVGFTVDRKNNLFMPVLKKVNEKKEIEIIEEKLKLIRKIYSSNFSNEDLSGGSISIATISEGFVKNHYPIIFPNQSAIIGIGSINLPISNLVSSDTIGISLAYDHRIVNGNYCANFLSQILKNIGNN